MAKTYGLLPSEVAARATTFDIMITDVFTTWERNEMNKASGKPTDLTQFDPDELKQILEAAKNGRRD
jgi:hypothetical protein